MPVMLFPFLRSFARMTTRTTLRCSLSSTSEDLGNESSARVLTSINSDGIAHVQLNRAHKLNALDLKMFEAIADAASTLITDRNIRAVILSGKGRAFCTGLDIQSILQNKPKKTFDRLLERPSGYGGDNNEIGNLAQDVGYLWRSLPVPVIAVLHGMCYGGGMQIALGADFRLATPDCKLSIMESKWGLIPDMSASITLRELVRMDVAKELTMTGRIITGKEATELGLITRYVDDPMVEAFTLASEISQRSPDSVALSKKLYQETWVAPETYCLQVETKLQKQLLATWNQVAASGRNFGWKLPYFKREKGSDEV